MVGQVLQRRVTHPPEPSDQNVTGVLAEHIRARDSRLGLLGQLETNIFCSMGLLGPTMC